VLVFKAVEESAKLPLEYYCVNVQGSITLLRSMEKHNVTNIVFSSSATVYGDLNGSCTMGSASEDCPINPTNTYGRTKWMVESIITDFIESKRQSSLQNGAKTWNGAMLRYFNPVGAHPSGLMGESPLGDPFNLFPLLTQVAVGKREKLLVFGNGMYVHLEGIYETNFCPDYDSKDGTAIRDYVHVQDIARGHLAALDYLCEKKPGVKIWNLGSGTGSTVMEVIQTFGRVAGRDIRYQSVARRVGDVFSLTANNDLAKKELRWQTLMSLEDACGHVWKWTENNPDGYGQKTLQNPVETGLQRMAMVPACLETGLILDRAGEIRSPLPVGPPRVTLA
jgi:UDP-glucose 4-epimerase